MNTATDGSSASPRATRPRGLTWVDTRRKLIGGAVAAVAAAAVLPFGGVATATTSAARPGPASDYIVQASAGQLADARAEAIALGGVIGAELPIVNGFTATLTPEAADALSHDADVRVVSPDYAGTTQGSSYDPATDPGSPTGLSNSVGYSTYWNAGLSGQGVGVALIDSGVAPVPALSASGKVFYGPDFTPTGYFTQVRGLDTFGHGTFMAGLIAGRDPGAKAPYTSSSSYFLGAAPDAHIVSVKVADASGATVESAVISAIQWVVAHRGDPGLNIKVLNLSLGIRSPLTYNQDPLDAAVEAAWKAGITVVAAAGNDGQHGMTAPANDPYVIAVGSVDTGSTMSVSDDTVASFSNVGDGTRNPDFGTPGTHIVSLRVPGSAIDQQYGAGSMVTSRLMRGSGTSESAALASGSAALLIGQRPGITPDQVKSTMAVHSTWLPNLSGTNLGAGELNMNWTLNAATEYRTQSWSPSTAFTAPVSAVMGATASTTPAGSTWTGSTWTSRNWTGSTWTGSTWTGSTWTGSTWTGSTWTGSTWTGSTWTGSTWTGSTWTGSTWTDAAWTTKSWS
ncbi:MAG TPA: S8 family serine peptidase [Acidothermaceae bacterium]